MQSSPLSLRSILKALDLDAACLPLLEEASETNALLRAHTPEAIYDAISSVGHTLHTLPKANQLIEDLEERINIITHKLKFIADESRPRVMFLADTTPAGVIHDAYLESITRVAGGVPLPPSADKSSVDVLVIISEKSVQQLLASIPALLSTPEWSQARAVKNGSIYIVHHHNHLRQPGANIADDIEILAEILHPKQFIFGRDDAWMAFNA